jgi:hypothetical protein
LLHPSVLDDDDTIDEEALHKRLQAKQDILK